MLFFSNDHIAIATLSDISKIRILLNSAYRGTNSKQGWTSEADLIQGEVRTDETALSGVMQQPGSVFLKYTDNTHNIIGCVNLQQHDHKVYLGMFSVSPRLQGAGVGKVLLKAAEEYTSHLSCSVIYMSVISVREELINWYKRHGYTDTGRRMPFVEDEVSGKHTQLLEFMVMEKLLRTD